MRLPRSHGQQACPLAAAAARASIKLSAARMAGWSNPAILTISSPPFAPCWLIRTSATASAPPARRTIPDGFILAHQAQHLCAIYRECPA
jgi:hypothetical protein